MTRMTTKKKTEGTRKLDLTLPPSPICSSIIIEDVITDLPTFPTKNIVIALQTKVNKKQGNRTKLGTQLCEHPICFSTVIEEEVVSEDTSDQEKIKEIEQRCLPLDV